MPSNNKGKVWTSDHIKTLRQYAESGWDANQLAFALGRTEHAINCQAEILGIHFHSSTPVTQAPSNTQKVEPVMTSNPSSVNRTVNTVTRIGNVDADKFTVDALLDIIEEQEAFVTRLKNLNKSPTIANLMKKHSDNVRELTVLLAVAIENETPK